MSEKYHEHTQTEGSHTGVEVKHAPKSPKQAANKIPYASLEENQKNFQETYGDVFSSITNALSVNAGKSEMLMAHESRVTPTIRNSGGSEWFMQLNSHPVRDIGVRFKLFAPLLAKIPLEDLPKSTPRALIELIEATKNSQTKSPENLRSLTAELIKLRGHPIVNLVIGNVFLKFHELRAQRVVDANRISSCHNALHKISNSPEILQTVYKKIRDICPSASPEKIAESLSQIRGSKELLKEYVSLRNYNGNVASKHGLEYRDIYASTVLVAHMLQKNALAARKPQPDMLANNETGLENEFTDVDYTLVG